jgi:excinuclease ABC subunit C
MGTPILKLKEIVSTFPAKPGVYLMKNNSGQVLYVGKAISLRDRVRSYVTGGDGRYQIPYLMEHVETIETIVCENENQALILERDLIRTHKPLYNIRLKDDKAYLLVRIDKNNLWPRIETVRYRKNDGAEYYGPYTSTYQLREILDLIRRVIPLRSCADTVLNNRQRPCLEYQIKRCVAPCCLAVDSGDYRQLVQMAVNILDGKASSIVPLVEKQMITAAEELKFELAATLRDKLTQLEGWIAGNRNVFHRGVDRHAFGLFREGDRAVLNVLHTREGRIAKSENFVFRHVWMEDDEFIETAIEQYYGDATPGEGRVVPREVIVPLDPAVLGMLEIAITRIRTLQGAESEVELLRPKQGVRLRLIELARLNAETHFATIFRAEADHTNLLVVMKSLFNLRQVPRRIECMDISNLQGTDIVGAIVVFTDGMPIKRDYRRYKIKTVSGQDDFGSIYEVTSRRLRRGMETGEFPDLLVIDGGKGQLNAALKARDDLRLEIEIISIAKIREEGNTERVFMESGEEPISLTPGAPLTLFMQRVRDEVHNYVIDYHREKRSNRMVGSTLDTIPGIGPARRKRLFAHFGSRDGIEKASVTEIAKIGRMSPLLAEKLLKNLRTCPS